MPGKISESISSLSFSGIFEHTTLSIGIAQWQKGFESRDLFKLANEAMINAQKNGGNQIMVAKNGMDNK